MAKPKIVADRPTFTPSADRIISARGATRVEETLYEQGS